MAEIEMEHLFFSYDGERDVLTDVSFSVESSETVGLIGANGAGKSTILKLLVGLVSGYRGNVRVNGMDAEKKNYKKIREKTGYVFQDSESQLFLSTVYEDVAFGPKNYGYSREETEQRTMEALSQVHMEEFRDQQIYRLSGGQKKLAAIASILSLQPEIILFDEPTIALDPKNRQNLIDIINNMKGTKIIASHDLDMIFDTCERTILLSDRTVVCDGRTSEILTDERLLEENGLKLPLSFSRRS